MNPTSVIDLNADLGEAVGEPGRRDDARLLDVVTSANIACGFHAGDAEVMRRTCRAAAVRNVTIGAHVSYRDLEGFGRRDIAIAAEALVDDLAEQIALLDTISAETGAPMRYVKAHGALYNRCAHDEQHSAALVTAVQRHPRVLALLVAPGSVAARLASLAGLATFTEGFVDRAYADDGTLVPRSWPDAVHQSVDAAVAQAVDIALHGRVRTHGGRSIALRAESLCVHGDTPHALDMAQSVRRGLLDAGIELRAFL